MNYGIKKYWIGKAHLGHPNDYSIHELKTIPKNLLNLQWSAAFINPEFATILVSTEETTDENISLSSIFMFYNIPPIVSPQVKKKQI